MTTLDFILFVTFLVTVVGLGIWQSRRREAGKVTTEGASGYFLAGRGLTWWLVGFSLIAANISTEQFVGMSGKAADWLGMAIASYEWMAAITLVVVAFLFLPKFLQCGIYTIPQFLELRYGVFSRTVMALVMMVILVGVPTASVIFSGAMVISIFFQDFAPLGLDLGNLTLACWLIGGIAAFYVFIGGLKACAWTDLVWGSSLIAGGAVIAILAFQTLANTDPAELMHTKVETSLVTEAELAEAGAIERFRLLNQGPAVDGPNLSGGKLHMVRPAADPEIPWTALIIGLWIPNFFYWGLNQYIMQRSLASKSLAEGQKGVVFAAGLKLLIPFVVVIPGILAFNLFSNDLAHEAMRKNERILEQLSAGEAMVFPFNEAFAKTQPDLARAVVLHNTALLGVDAPPLNGDWSPSVALAAQNADLIQMGRQAGHRVATQLVGYDYDSAFPTLLRNLLQPGMTWFVLAAITGAVISSLASMLNSASTIFSMDLYNKVRKTASERELVMVGRICVVVFVVIACIIAPNLRRPEFGGIFTFIQEFQGFISPGVLAVFLFGILSKRTPRFAGWLGILLNAALYGFLKYSFADISFLNRMAICFGIVLLVLYLLTIFKPLKSPITMPVNKDMDMRSSRSAKIGGAVICLATVVLYGIFW